MQNKMDIFKRTKKYLIIWIVIFASLLIGALLSLFFINKERLKNQNLVDELSIASKEDVVTLKRAIRNYEENANKVENILVDKNEVFTFINEVESLAKSSGGVVTVQGIDLFDVLKSGESVRSDGQNNAERDHGKFVMNVRVDGSWDAVTKFLLKMENIPKHSQIQALRLVSVFDSNTKNTKWSGNFNIITTTN